MINLQPTLKNDLVELRPLRPNDFKALYQAAKDPGIWAQHQNRDRWKMEVFKEFFNDAIQSKGALAILDAKTGELIGSSRFQQSSQSTKAIEIGWTFLSKNYWGGRYNQSFKSLMMGHAFEHFDHILFHVDRNNLRSQKAVIKLGGRLLDKKGPLGHLHTTKSTGVSFVVFNPKP